MEGARMTQEGAGRRALHWLFKDRASGRIVVAQAPNWSLRAFIAAYAASAVLRLAGSPLARPLALLGAIALVIWALDEIARGCNPFRRMLGVLVLVVLAVRWLPR